MRCLIYKACEWIEPFNVPFIYSHALNRKLNPMRHCHDFYEIIFLFSGKAKHCVNGECYQMNPGSVAFLRPLEWHVFFEQSDEIELFSISVTVSELDFFLSAYNIRKEVLDVKGCICFSLNHGSQHTILAGFRNLRVGTEKQICAKIRVILGMTLQEYMLHLENISGNWIDEVLTEMQKPELLFEGVSAMLRITHLSHSQLCRIIKRHTGMTPQQCIKDLRLKYAYDLIMSTNIPCTEISEMVGYNSSSHFSISFKSKYGITPFALRKDSGVGERELL